MSTKGARVLVVEDDPYIVVAVRRGLESHGYDVDAVGTGEEALRLAEKADLVITDLRLPSMDGMGLLEALQRINARTPVIVMTAETKQDDQLQTPGAAANDD